MSRTIQTAAAIAALLLASCLSLDEHDPIIEEGTDDPGTRDEPSDPTGSDPVTDPETDPSNPGDEEEAADPEEGEPTGDPNIDQGELLEDAAGPVYVLQAIRDTYLKVSTDDSAALNDDELCLVVAGQTLLLESSALPSDHPRHFEVSLLEPIEGCELLGGFIFGDHFRIAEAPHMVDAEVRTSVTAVVNTWFKRSERQSGDLAPSDLCAVFAGETLSLASPPQNGSARHLRVRLAAPRTGCAFTEGFLYAPHLEVATTVVLTATSSTWLKAEPVQSSSLDDDQRCVLGAREMLELSGEPQPASGDHLRVELARPRSGCALGSGYIYGPHFDLGGLALAENPLEVRYFYQYNNRNEPGGTCGITSGAMLLAAHGSTLTPDDLYRRYGKRQGQSPTGLASIYRSELGYGQGSYAGTRAQIRRHIDEGRPIVIHGNFTGSGHIMMVVGYDDTGWILHDPAGRWAGCYRCGYPSSTSTNGRYVHYSYSSMSASVIGADGNVWMSVGSTEPFTF